VFQIIIVHWMSCQVLDAIELMIRIKQQLDRRKKRRKNHSIAGWETTTWALSHVTVSLVIMCSLLVQSRQSNQSTVNIIRTLHYLLK